MGQIEFADKTKLKSDSQHLVIDSGLSNSLIPSEDFKSLTETLDKTYGVQCAKSSDKKDNFSAQVSSSDCTCKDIKSLPALDITILANGEDKNGQTFAMPRETYIKDSGNGKCELLLNPNDMQIGARYGENYWVMGDQFM